MSEGGRPASPAEDSEATASEASHRAVDTGHKDNGSPVSTATDDARQARGGGHAPPDQTRLAAAASRPDPSGRTGAAAADSLMSPGVVTPSLSVPLPGAALPTPSSQRSVGEAALLHHVLSGHSAATFLDASGSPRVQASTGSATLGGRNSLLGSLDSLLAASAAGAAAPAGAAQPRRQLSGSERMLAGLLSALRQQQRSADGSSGGAAGAAAAAQLPAPGGIHRQLSDSSSIQALLSSMGFKLRANEQGASTTAAPQPLQPPSPKVKEAVGESAEGSARQSSRGLHRTNSLPIPDPELRRILTGDLTAPPPTRSAPPESSAVAFQLGQPLPNPFAGFANDLLQRQSSSLASHPPPHWSAAALAVAAAQPPPAQQAANSDTGSRRSGDGQRDGSTGRGASGKRKAATAGLEASAEQSAESLPRPNMAHVRRALADVLDWSASSKPGLARQWSTLHSATSAPMAAANAAGHDLQRHAGDFLRHMQDSLPAAMRSAQSLPPRSSLTADSHRALERSLDPTGAQGTGRAIAEEVQRLLGRARAAQAAAAAAPARADESDAAADDSEAPRDGEAAADTAEDRINRRRLSNRESARRTRQRRNNEMAALRAANEQLHADAERLQRQVADLAAANNALLASIPCLGDPKQQQELRSENASLKAELLELRAAVTQHLAAHASQLSYAQSIALSQVIEEARRQASARENEEGHP